MQKVVFFTGAGISAESGLSTYRDADGTWNKHNVDEVATKDAWKRDRHRVTSFHNELRRFVRAAEPNDAHRAIADLERDFEVSVITQNVDDLHERAGSTTVLHLHGEILRARSTLDSSVTVPVLEDLSVDDKCPLGSRLRPDVVWFDEDVPEMTNAVALIKEADVVVIVGTSLQVYPAADLINYVEKGVPIHLVDPREFDSPRVVVWNEKATSGVPAVAEFLREIYC